MPADNFQIAPERGEAKAAAQRWLAFDARGLKAPADCIDFAVVDAATGIEIARVWQEEDARRLAAVPDLLEALKAMLARYVSLAGSGDCGFWDPETENEVIAARSAIQRAEAGQ